jgi:glycerophosphoryl diester phosphodiesterase
MLTKITAHRGLREHFPENTLIAFEKAVEAGVERIEFDVQATKDNHIVVHHDYYLGHPDNGEGLIYEQDLAYIQTLDAGKYMAPEFATTRIPTLEEVFNVLQKSIEYEIEVKESSPEFLELVLKTVQAYDLLSQTEFTSPSPYTLSKLKQLEPRTTTGLFLQLPPSWMGLALAQKLALSELMLGSINIAHCPIEIVTPDFVQRLHAQGIKVHVGNCNTEENLRKAYQYEVDQLSTDRVALALQIREECQKRISA